ncbi:MAG: mechanosensitive ion channel domain-containing protein [Hyphomicrobiaceae bacterium]
MATFFRTPFIVVLAALVALCAAPWHQAANAQIGLGAKSEAPAKKPQVPEPLTREAVRDLISELDDKQVRKLLIDRLSAQADARAKALASEDNRSVLQILDGYRSALGTSLWETVTRLQNIPTSFGKAFQNFAERRGDNDYGGLLVSLATALLGGIAAVWLCRRSTHGPEQRILAARPPNLWRKLTLIIARLAIHVSHILALVLVSYAITIALTQRGSPDRFTLFLIIQTIAWIWLATSLARFVMAPTQSNLRLCPLDDATANLLTSRVTLVAAIAGIGFGFMSWLFQMGATFGETRFGFWVNLLIHGVLLLTIWQSRHGVVAMLTADQPREKVAHRTFSVSQHWPEIAMALVIAHWFIVEIIVATGNATPGILPVMMITLATLIGLPFLDHAIRALVCNLAPVNGDATPPLQAAHRETQHGLTRCGRVVLGLAGILGILKLWGVDPHALAEQGVGARFASGSIDILLIALVCYAIWEFVTIVSERQLAIERAVMGIDEVEGEAMAEGEGGKGETRLATIVPLVRLAARIVIVALGALAIINQLGINITPLLAGAGIIGLAVGFGAQTLVKDIISGLFFLIDDAFRKGEYIDIGDVKGTVEKISVRSMQLRHHNGPLNTVPFGDINFVTNFSRDWVVMKLPLRLTYDTDAEAVRKMIKKLGQELMEEPALKGQFLQPLKSQGVIQMEDSAMIMRVKFMTRPGDQWVIRRIVFARIRDLFEKEGIKFANREVTVRLADDDRAETLTGPERRAVGAAARSTIEQAEAAGAKG